MGRHILAVEEDRKSEVRRNRKEKVIDAGMNSSIVLYMISLVKMVRYGIVYRFVHCSSFFFV